MEAQTINRQILFPTQGNYYWHLYQYSFSGEWRYKYQGFDSQRIIDGWLLFNFLPSSQKSRI